MSPIEIPSLVFCPILGKWTARCECGPGCEEPHWLMPITTDMAASWLNMLIQVREDLIDGERGSRWLPDKIAAILPRSKN